MKETEWNSRIQSAAQALGIPPEDLTTLLDAKIGIAQDADTGLDMLDDEEVFKFGDFRDAVPGPIAKLRLAFKCLRGGKKAEDRGNADERTAALQALGHKAKLEYAETAELLKLYSPEKTTNDPVTQILADRFEGRKIIAFKDDGAIALMECVIYATDLEQGLVEETDAIMVDGKLTKLWPIGVVPDTMIDEDPLFPGRALHNNRSQINHRDWSNVPLATRQFCRIILTRGDINVENRDAVLRLVENAQGDTSKLAAVYPEADLDYREAKKRDELPKLKVALSAQRKPNNPFGIKRSY